MTKLTKVHPVTKDWFSMRYLPSVILLTFVNGFHCNGINRSLVVIQQSWKMWSNVMCPLGPFSLAHSILMNFEIDYIINACIIEAGCVMGAMTQKVLKCKKDMNECI